MKDYRELFPPFLCECGRMFASEWQLRQHRASHAENDQARASNTGAAPGAAAQHNEYTPPDHEIEIGGEG
jgi:hypothetical protein